MLVYLLRAVLHFFFGQDLLVGLTTVALGNEIPFAFLPAGWNQPTLLLFFAGAAIAVNVVRAVGAFSLHGLLRDLRLCSRWSKDLFAILPPH
mgnify:CR=1 FL=1